MGLRRTVPGGTNPEGSVRYGIDGTDPARTGLRQRCRARDACRETARVGRRRRANVGRLERNIAGRFAEDMLQQRGLARLAWSDKDHAREVGRGLSEDWLQRTRDVATAHRRSSACNYAL